MDCSGRREPSSLILRLLICGRFGHSPHGKVTKPVPVKGSVSRGLMVPRAGLEPARLDKPSECKSDLSTNSSTGALMGAAASRSLEPPLAAALSGPPNTALIPSSWHFSCHRGYSGNNLYLLFRDAASSSKSLVGQSIPFCSLLADYDNVSRIASLLKKSVNTANGLTGNPETVH